jgi:hypothetical protein
MTTRVLPILLALTAGLAINTHAANLVSDPGFESAGLGNHTTDLADTFWNVATGTVSVFNTADSEGGVPHSGNQMVYLGFGLLVNTISQTLVTVPGQSYTISYWVADNDPNSLVVDFGNQNLFTGFAPTNDVTSPADYVQSTFTVTADATFTDLTFAGRWLGGDGDFGTLLDDVSVTTASAPEPATWAFIAVGLLTLKLRSYKASQTPKKTVLRSFKLS